ncbi:MAG: ferritin-like domain-containing protein [Acidobacteria bacterium]|nr:ferritin-like domain-containing protein [Acidobacteriota bacterium]
MTQFDTLLRKFADRRSFLKTGIAAGAATVGTGLLGGGTSALGQDNDEDRDDLTRGDIAILRFLNALEQIEADLWTQYAELGGVRDPTIPGVNGGNPLYAGALQILDGDMSQYVTDNTDDEISHAAFLKAYLESKGSYAVDLSPFATIPGSTATGSSGKLRLTNLMKLTVDTSYWSRYRSVTNPDFDPSATFAQAVPSLNVGQHTAIPRTDADTAGSSLSSDNTKSITTHLQAIAFTAGFHFAFIEQGGTSLYPTLAQKVTNLEVLRVLLSIGPSETMHFQTWQDKAGNALPLTDIDNGPGGTGATVTFTTLADAQGETNPESLNGDTLQANLIMPEPTHFLNRRFPPVAIIRPTSTKNGGAMAAVQAFKDDGLFIGQKNPEFLRLMVRLAEEADEAQRRS